MDINTADNEVCASPGPKLHVQLEFIEVYD